MNHIGTTRRTHTERLAALAARPGNLARFWDRLQRPDVLLRIGLCMLSVTLLWFATTGWRPPFPYRRGEVRARDIVASVKFSVVDDERTARIRDQRLRETLCFYRHDPQAIIDLRETLKAKVGELVQAESFEKVSPEFRNEFFEIEPAKLAEQQAVFDAIKATLTEPDGSTHFEQMLTKLCAEWERNGVLDRLDERHTPEKGSQTEIRVYPEGKIDLTSRVEVDTVRQSRILAQLERRLMDEWRDAKLPDQYAMIGVRWLADLLRRRIKPTLSYDEPSSARAREEVEARVAGNPEMIVYEPGKSVLARGGRPIESKELELLRREHETRLAQVSWGEKCLYAGAIFGMFVALHLLCGYYVAYREPRLLDHLRQLATVLGAVIVTIIATQLFAIDNWRAEVIPLIFLGMTLTISYRQELALLLSSATALVMTLTLGHGLADFVVYAASVSAAILVLGRIRSRTRLIHVGAMVGLVSFLTAIGVCTVVGQAFGSPTMLANPATVNPDANQSQFYWSLVTGAAWQGACGVMAGLLMTALLPFVERLFDVQTDIKLLELGDAAHPLLQELVRRAPGTYNHSINVASIGEAAAESIGANGLLVRVGAYFHDIGKMLKPSYFIENQGQDVNRHLSLMPAMSTLVIIAHVKDGANLARQHHLPRSIIAFIEQHHGTTLVEYFYRQATRNSESDPDGPEVDEASFRYPGPKPQTKEAGVLMLADAVEGASRALVDPTPARIENLVHDIAMKRLLDGQFEECDLTLQELHIIEESLVKSLTAVYHGRVKYPDQQSA
ncbi:MAG: hypothetical protein RIS70_4298 [Planctomycetota bacterium]|jgi:putative nucleotidyltransferase with HDIG domain